MGAVLRAFGLRGRAISVRWGGGDDNWSRSLPLVLIALFAVALAVLPPAAAARADEDPAYLALSAGGYDVNDDETAAEFRLEYRHDERYLYFFKPFIGVMGTTDEALYGYFGIAIDFYFGKCKCLIVQPNAAVGAYYDGNGKDLGHTLEFRTGGEIAYRFANRSRLGIAFQHISNASIADRNPGTESVVGTYSMPIDWTWEGW